MESDRTITVDFQLESAELQLEAVEVVAQRELVRADVSATQEIISTTRIEQMPVLRVDEFVGRLKGIALVSTTEGNGLSAVVMDYGDFYGTRIAANEQGFEETGIFSPKAWALGVAFSQKVTDRFSYGVHAKYAFQDLGSAWVGPVGLSLTDPGMVPSLRPYSDGGWALDVGACYDFQYNGIRFGASLQNISREIRYESEAFPMPFSVNFGATVEPLQFFMDGDAARALVVLVESRHPRDYNEKLKFGAEYKLFPEFIARFGYMTNYDERGVTAGVGFRQLFDNLPLRFDYAYQAFGIFGAVHHFTLGVTF